MTTIRAPTPTPMPICASRPSPADEEALVAWPCPVVIIIVVVGAPVLVVVPGVDRVDDGVSLLLALVLDVVSGAVLVVLSGVVVVELEGVVLVLVVVPGTVSAAVTLGAVLSTGGLPAVTVTTSVLVTNCSGRAVSRTVSTRVDATVTTPRSVLVTVAIVLVYVTVV